MLMRLSRGRSVAPSRPAPSSRAQRTAARSYSLQKGFGGQSGVASAGATSADAKEFAKLKNLPPEVRLKLVLEEFRQKEVLPGWAKAISTKLSESPDLVNKIRDYAGYRKYGLLQNDIIIDNFEMTEAIVRLPKELLEARDRRIKTAFYLNGKAAVLPEDQWTTETEDVPYVIPYLLEVERELQDRQMFRATFF